jgi:Kef-type K+ transport system membrane component KefB
MRLGPGYRRPMLGAADTAEITFNGLLVVMIFAVVIPLALGLFPKLPLPGSVVEITAGILIGPAVLGWVTPDRAIDVLAKLGVAFLLFLAGLELDFYALRGRPLKFGLTGFAISVGLGLALTVPLGLTGVVINPLLVAIILSATALGIVMPVLKDAGQLSTRLGTLVIAACSVAEFGAIVLLSMFFSGTGAPHPLQTAAKLVILALAVLVIALVAARAGHWRPLHDVVARLQDTSAQIRIRIAVLALLALLVLSQELKFDAILGAFMAGALLSALTDREHDEELGGFRHKLDAIGFGFFIPVFFVATGIAFPLNQLFDNSSALLRIPLFLILLLIARGLPALLLRRFGFGRREVLAAGLMQATSLSFIVVATEIGVTVGELRPVNAASLVAAGMLSVLIFPMTALAVLRKSAPAATAP